MVHHTGPRHTPACMPSVPALRTPRRWLPRNSQGHPHGGLREGNRVNGLGAGDTSQGNGEGEGGGDYEGSGQDGVFHGRFLSAGRAICFQLFLATAQAMPSY